MLTRILFDQTGQLVQHVTPRPVATATYVLEDLDEPLEGDARELQAGAALVLAATVSLELDAAAGARAVDPLWIPVASTVGATVGPWWIEAADGIGEVVWVEGWLDNDGLRIRHPLVRTYAAEDTVQPLTISLAFPNAIAADDDYLEARLRVVWSYTVAGHGAVVAQEQVTVVRQTVTDVGVPEVLEFVGAFAPDIMPRFRTGELEGWAKLSIRLVQAQARGEGIEPTKLLAGDRMVELVSWRMLLILADNGHSPGSVTQEVFAKSMRGNFDRCWQALTVGSPGKDAVDIDEDGVTTAPPERAGLNLSW